MYENNRVFKSQLLQSGYYRTSFHFNILSAHWLLTLVRNKCAYTTAAAGKNILLCPLMIDRRNRRIDMAGQFNKMKERRVVVG